MEAIEVYFIAHYSYKEHGNKEHGNSSDNTVMVIHTKNFCARNLE